MRCHAEGRLRSRPILEGQLTAFALKLKNAHKHQAIRKEHERKILVLGTASHHSERHDMPAGSGDLAMGLLARKHETAMLDESDLSSMVCVCVCGNCPV